MSMTLEQQRDIVQAAIDGKTIEVFRLTKNEPLGGWAATSGPFNFACEHRIAPPALRPHWPALVQLPDGEYAYSTRLYTENDPRLSTIIGFVRLMREYPPVMLP